MTPCGGSFKTRSKSLIYYVVDLRHPVTQPVATVIDSKTGAMLLYIVTKQGLVLLATSTAVTPPRRGRFHMALFVGCWFTARGNRICSDRTSRWSVLNTESILSRLRLEWGQFAWKSNPQ